MSNQNVSSLTLTQLFLVTTVFGLAAGMRGCEAQLYNVAQVAHGEEVTGLDLKYKTQLTYLALMDGCALAGGFLLGFNCFRHNRTLQHPGHWLLGLAAIWYLGERAVVMTRAYHIAYFDFNSSQYIHFYSWAFSVVELLTFAGWVAATALVAKRFGKMWWFTFGVSATLNLVTVASSLFGKWGDYSDALRLVLMVAIVGSVGQDIRQSATRDWLHWLGVVYTLFMLGLFALIHLW